MKKIILLIILNLAIHIGLNSQCKNSSSYNPLLIKLCSVSESTKLEKQLKLQEFFSLKEYSNVDTNQYAILYVYRPKNVVGAAIGYDLYIDNDITCRVKNNFKKEIKIYKQGQIEIWGKTESKASVSLDVKYGEKYYLKCGLKMGVLVGRPELTLVYPAQGESDFSHIKAK